MMLITTLVICLGLLYVGGKVQLCLSLQPGHHSSLTATYLQYTTNQERYDQCGNQRHSRGLLKMGILMLETC
jgi:hypothetical protein